MLRLLRLAVMPLVASAVWRLVNGNFFRVPKSDCVADTSHFQQWPVLCTLVYQRGIFLLMKDARTGCIRHHDWQGSHAVLHSNCAGKDEGSRLPLIHD